MDRGHGHQGGRRYGPTDPGYLILRHWVENQVVVQRPVEKRFIVRFDYTQINEVMTLVKRYNCRVLQQEMQLFCNMTIGIPVNRLSEISYKLQELRGVEFVKMG